MDPRLIRRLPSLRTGMAVVALGATIGTACTIAQAALLARIVAAIFIHHDRAGAISGDLAGLVGAIALKALAAGAIEWMGQRTSGVARAQLRQQFLGAVSRLGSSWLSRQDGGQVVTAAGPGIESLDGYITRALPAVIAAGITPPLVLAAIGFNDWPSLLLLALTLPLAPVFLILIGITTKKHMDRQWATLAKLAGQFLDLLEGLTTLKVYGRSRAQVAAVREGTDRYRRRTLQTLRVAFLSGLVLDLLATLSVALVAVTVGIRLDHGDLSLQRALTVLLLAPEVYAPLRAVGAQHHATEEARAVLNQTLATLEAAEGLEDGQRPEPAGSYLLNPASDGTVARLRGVGYTYPGRDLPALHDLDVDLRPGQFVALVGPSGAGKTTLLSLLLGQIAPRNGRISVGTDDRLLDSAPAAPSWRANVAWVPQRPRPTQDDVATEVRLGDPELDDHQLQEILEMCAAPAAHTPLGEDGVALSAGQRRRVAMARAVARARAVRRQGGTPLVLLDEPTEDLDPLTETIVAQVLVDVAGWAAVVAATHDPALRAVADREIALIDGRLVTDVTNTFGPSRTASVGAQSRPNSAPSMEAALACAVLPASKVQAPVAGDADSASAADRAGAADGAVRAGLRLRRVLADTPGAMHSLLLACVFGAVGGMSGLALTATSVWLICRAAQHPNVQALAVAVVGVRTFALSRALLRYFERLSAHDGALRLLAELRARVFSALEPLAPAGLGQFRRGDLLRRFTSDVDGAQEGLIRTVVPLAGAAATSLAAILLVGSIDLGAGWILAGGLVLAGVVVPLLTRRAGLRTDLAATAAGHRDGLITGLLDGLPELSAYGVVQDHLQRIAEADGRVRRVMARAGRGGAFGVAGAGTVAALGVTGVVAATARGVATGATSGILLGVAAAASLVAFEAVNTLPAAYAALGRCRSGLQRVEAVLATDVPVPDPAMRRPAPETVLDVHSHGLTLRPGPAAPPVLVDADFSVASGQRIAVVGPSGCGKTSLLAAVLRLLPTEGHPLTVRGTGTTSIDLEELEPDQVPPLIAGSLQGDHVFSTTLRDNLRVVAPDAGDDDLDAVASRVGLSSWLQSLPEGWGTQAGADGCHLSGGQRQRLLVARALLANPQVLVLDEPTAHLDGDTQQAVMADLLRASIGHTLIMSTHRSGMLDRFDQILGVENRRLVPQRPPVMAVTPQPSATTVSEGRAP